MDKTTHDIRLANWKAIIERCQSRPQDQSAKQWLAANNVPEKQYYYWLRKIRSMAYQEMNVSLPVVSNSKDTVPASFAEFSGHDLLEPGSTAAVIIRTSRSTIEISSGVSERLMIKLVKAVTHAL